MLSDHLASQILDLGRQSLLDSIVFLSHDFSPDRVEFVEDLTNARFGHLALELVSDLQDSAHGLGRNPIVVFGLLAVLGTALGT